MSARADDPGGPNRELVRRLNAMLAALQGREPRWRYFQRAGGPMFFWTVERYDADAGHEHAGRYVSGVYEPVGPGARSGRATRFRLAEDSLSAHALRRDAKARALRLFRAGTKASLGRGGERRRRRARVRAKNEIERRSTMVGMAVEVKKLDVRIGDVVEIADRRYDVVSDKAGGVALEPAITRTVAELRAEHGARPMTDEEFERHFGDLPSDGEG